MNFQIRLLACLCLTWQALWPSIAQAKFAPKVVVTSGVILPLIDEIMQGVTQAKALLGPGQSPHHAHLRPSQAALLHEADIVIIPDHSLMPSLKHWLNKHQQSGRILLVLSELDEVQALPYQSNNPFLLKAKTKHKHGHNHSHKAGELDPHFWLDPLRMANILAPIAQKLGEYSPEHRDTFSANAQLLALHLRADLTPNLQAIIDTAKAQSSDNTSIKFLTYHDAYQYFTQRFGLTQPGFITQRPEIYQGAKTLAELLQQAKNKRVNCVISETETSSVKNIVKLTYARLVKINPDKLYRSGSVAQKSWVQNDYDRTMLKLVTEFAECLR